MFTESELRDALRHSAARADALPADVLTTPSTGRSEAGTTAAPATSVTARSGIDTAAEPLGLAPVLPITPPAAQARRRRVVAPIAAAAAVVAAVTVGSMLVSGSDQPPAQQQAASSSQPPPAAPATVSSAVDLVTVTASGVVNNEIGSTGDPQLGSQTVRRVLGMTDSMTLTVVPGSAPYFDAGRIPRDRPVPIAGTTGYYSKLKLFPLDANTGPGHDKWLPHWTIAFQTPAGDWAFAWIEKAMSAENPDPTDTSVDDPTRIAAEYAALGATFTPNASRLPFRIGYLTAGLRFSSAGFDTGVPAPGFAGLSLVDGAKAVHVQLVSADSGIGEIVCSSSADGQQEARAAGAGAPIAADGGTSGDCGAHLRRTVGDLIIDLDARGYDRAEAQLMLDSIELAPDLTDRSTFFPLPS